MPTYEYICTSCGHEFEIFQRITEAPRKRCPQCGRRVERKIGAGAGIIFKGSGFYATDYRSPDYRARQKAESGGKTESGAGEAGKSAGGTPGSDSKAVGKPERPGPRGGGAAEGRSGSSEAAKRRAGDSAAGGSGTKPAGESS